MTNTYDIESLPLSVPVPKWPVRGDTVEIALGGKITGTLHMIAMANDDVYVDGELTYRGQTYEVRYGHTNDAGEPKGYYYAADGGQVHGVLPGPGIADWARADFFSPRAPKTFVEPLLARVASAVQQYLTTFAEHAAQSRLESITQNLSRAATDYNRKAIEAKEALDEYEATLAKAATAMAEYEATQGPG